MPAASAADAPPRLAGKRLLIAEEALKDRVGHWYEYVKAVAELSRRAGAEVATAAHAGLDPQIAAETGGAAVFPYSSWDGVYDHPSAWRRYLGVLRHNWLVCHTMRAFLRRHGRVDCLFAPTVFQHHVLGWRLLWLFERKRIGRLVLLFRNSIATYPAGSTVPAFKRSALPMKWALQSLAGAIGRGEVALVTDSTRLAREYEALCGVAFEVFPSPRVAPFEDADAPKAPDQPLVFASLGPARFEKGIDRLQAAIRQCLGSGIDGGLPRAVTFVIQWNSPIVDAAGALYEPDPVLAADPRVELITESLDSAAYDAAVAGADCILLPYERLSYFARISGVAVEAATAGIPIIYTRDTWTGDLVESCGAGIGVDDGDVPGLAAAIRTMAANHATFRAEAMARRDKAREEHSSRAFVELLWGDHAQAD